MQREKLVGMNHIPMNYLGSVLLVEDVDDSRYMLRRLLELEGFHVLEATDGAMALEALRKYPCDIILLDLRMPNLDGVQFTRALRASTQFQTIPVIVVSAYDDDESRAEARAAGCNDYVTKPIDVDLLTVLLKKYLSQSRAGH